MKTFMRVVFGFVWLVDGMLKFQPGMADAFTQMITSAGQGQPAFLQPWFFFWAGAVSPHPAFFVYLIGTSEVLLGLALIFGFMRKAAYSLGALLSLVIWAVPEGFGGPYGPGSTDIGTGIIYCFMFISLIIINATYGPSMFSLDYFIEKRLKWWKKIAEFGSDKRR